MGEKTSDVLLRGLPVWLLIIGTEFIHGTIRVLLIEPLAGDLRARQISVLTGSIIILIISYLFVEKLRATDFIQLFAVGLLWLGLTVSFEIILGRFIFGLSWDRIGSDYDVSRGGLLPFGLVFLALAPAIAARLKMLIFPKKRIFTGV
ncbi:MAG: hypothetical protein R2747_22625 [Pyrinomonadaceae bacterium]